MLRPAVIFPEVDVAEPEFRRLLGYPRGATPSARAEELAAWARAWFAAHARPWSYLREVPVGTADGRLTIDGVPFASAQLLRHFEDRRAAEAVVFVVSAGRACEEHARELWLAGKPDEYFFLETFGSAVVERLTALVNARVCADADLRGQRAIPHYSPGYATWDVAEQPALFEIIRRARDEALPEPVEVLPSGMVRPKKSLLGVIGLTREPAASATAGVPCERCSWSPCAYRRVPYRHAEVRGPSTDASAASPGPRRPEAPLTRDATYSLAPRALEKWSRERLQLQHHADRSVTAVFRFDGTTCSNMGQPLAFDYRIELGAPGTCYRIERTSCTPADGDAGHRSMCEYLRGAEGLMAAIATERPLVGEPLDAVLTWSRERTSTGCYCDAASRAHKWGLAFEVVHFALARQPGPAPAATPATSRPRTSDADPADPARSAASARA